MNTLLVLFITLLISSQLASGQLEVGFYSHACPHAESVITEVVKETVQRNPRTAAILLRLQFHDCFVDGCDGSILVDTVNNEKSAFAHIGVLGFDIIETAKSKLETLCPGVVSCSDIIALAARDAVSLSNGPFYQVPTGRKDGRVSDIKHASTIPDVNDPIDILKSKFEEKGLTEKELVLLTAGAHTIGTTACFFMRTRLYNFSSSNKSDPSINPEFLNTLKNTCPLEGNGRVRTSLDPKTQGTFDDQPFENIKSGFAVLSSDARLMDDPVTRGVVEFYLNAGEPEASFERDFINAIIKMGEIGVKSGPDGEIRKICSKFN